MLLWQQATCQRPATTSPKEGRWTHLAPCSGSVDQRHMQHGPLNTTSPKEGRWTHLAPCSGSVDLRHMQHGALDTTLLKEGRWAHLAPCSGSVDQRHMQHGTLEGCLGGPHPLRVLHLRNMHWAAAWQALRFKVCQGSNRVSMAEGLVRLASSGLWLPAALQDKGIQALPMIGGVLYWQTGHAWAGAPSHSQCGDGALVVAGGCACNWWAPGALEVQKLAASNSGAGWRGAGALEVQAQW